MMRIRILSLAAMCAALAVATPASAAPIGAAALKGVTTNIDSAASKVHYRRYRHCHRRYGRRRCHGRRHYRSGRYGWPGFGIYFGKRHHHRHHHGRRWHKRRH